MHNQNKLNKNRELKRRIDELSGPKTAELNQLIINTNIEICKKYGFEQGSNLFFECILILMKDFKLAMDNDKYKWD